MPKPVPTKPLKTERMNGTTKLTINIPQAHPPSTMFTSRSNSTNNAQQIAFMQAQQQLFLQKQASQNKNMT